MLHKVEIDGRKGKFFGEDILREWMTHHTIQLIIGIGDFFRRVGRNIDGLQGVHGGFSIGKIDQEGRMLLEFCDAKHLCIASTWFRVADKRKLTHVSGFTECETDFLMGRVDGKFFLGQCSYRGVAA